MADDDRVNWRLANKYGIWMRHLEDRPTRWAEDANDPGATYHRWNSGRATDLLQSPDGNLTIATDSGGVWRMSSAAVGTVCLSDLWSHSHFQSLAQARKICFS